MKTAYLICLFILCALETFGQNKIIHIEIIGKELTSREEDLLNQTISPFLNADLEEKTLHEISDAIKEFYKGIHRPLVSVEIPEQEIVNGTICFEVHESRVGEIRVINNCYFPDSFFLDQISLSSGDKFELNRVLSNVSFLNRNPFLDTDIILTPGQEQNTTDIELFVHDRRSYDYYVGTDNTGYEQTGQGRFFTGIHLGNLFWQGQLFSFQFTSSYDFQSLLSYTGNYVIPLFRKQLIRFFGGYSSVISDMDVPEMKTHGNSLQGSMRYVIPLSIGNQFTHEMQFGADYKRTNNSVVFGGFTVIGQNVNLFQLMLGYNFNHSSRYTRTYFEMDFFGSWGQWLNHQTPHDYNLLRPGAGPTYLYGRGALQNICYLPLNASLATTLQGQLSSKNLLPSEELGLGGYGSVRGYDERIVNVDNGLLANLEVRAPSFQILRFLKGRCKKSDSFTFLAFTDFGLGAEHKKEFFNEPQYVLWSVGPGLRYQIGDWFNARCDWGLRLRKSGLPKQSGNRVDFSCVINF